MAERIIDPLEIVETDHHHSEILVGSLRALDQKLKSVAQKGASGKSSQGIVIGNVVDVLVRSLTFGQVVGDSDESGDAFVVVSQCGDDKLYRDARSILPNVGPFPLVDEAVLWRNLKYLMIGRDVGGELRR